MISLSLNIGAQLAPSEPVCPGNRIIFSCQQSGDNVARWEINLPEGQTLRNNTAAANTSQSLTFMNDPGFNFEVHVVSISSDSITTELQATAVRELNGITVICTGASGRFMSTIQVASVSE